MKELLVALPIITGTIGTITGIAALSLTIWQIRKSAPRLHLAIEQSDHWIDNSWQSSFPEHPGHTKFNVRICVSNSGKEPITLSEASYQIVNESMRWRLGAGFVVEDKKGARPDETLALKWVEIPGRGIRFLYVVFKAPVPLRHDVAATFVVTDAGGRVFTLRTVSVFLHYERPESQVCSREARKDDGDQPEVDAQ
jgi:hypothetical protein